MTNDENPVATSHTCGYHPGAVGAGQIMLRGYQWLSAFFLLQTFGAFGAVSRLIYGDWQGGFAATTKLALALNLLVMAASVELFRSGLMKTRKITTGGGLVILVAVLFTMSTAWSIDPATSLKRGVEYGFFVLGLIGLVSNLKDDAFFALLCDVCFASAIASLALLAISPAAAYMPSGSPDDPLYLRGVFAHKSVLGEVMAAGTLAAVHRLRVSSKRRLFGIFKCIVFLGVTLASRSTTSLLIILFLYISSAIIMLLRQGGARRVIGITMSAVFLITALLAGLFPDVFLSSFGKDATLTGRTELWAFVETEIMQRPLQGWGFFAFWQPSNPIANEISETLGWTVPHAHNGLLELLLEVGFAGAAFILAVFARNVWLAWRCLKTYAREAGTSAFLCFATLIFNGMTEAVLVDSAEVMTIIFFALGLMCERGQHARRWPSQPSRARRLVVGRIPVHATLRTPHHAAAHTGLRQPVMPGDAS